MTAERRFSDPRLAIDRVVTRGGDRGETSLADGTRVLKTSVRIEAYGTVDELNSHLGVALALCRELQPGAPRLAELAARVRRVQQEVFNLGSLLATPPDALREGQPRITSADIEALEREIEQLNRELEPLRSFVLPGGSRLSAALHVCRVVCRRAERRCLRLLEVEPGTDELAPRYLNRLGDALFVWSRWADRTQGTGEDLWDPNRASSGDP